MRAFRAEQTCGTPVYKVNFYAYGTLKYGAEVGAGDVEGDGFDEVLTGPGPSAAFGANLRGFDYDGTVLRAKATIKVFAFPGSRSGANAAAGDLDGDGMDEIACGAGPEGAFGSRMTAFQHDAGPKSPIAALAQDVYGLAYGVRVSAGTHGY